MTIAWLAYLLVVPAIAGAAALAYERAARIGGRPSRFAWAAATAGSLILACLGAFGSRGPADVAGAASGTVPAMIASAGVGAQSAITSRLDVGADALGRIALGGWALMSMLAVGRLVAGALVLRRERRRWTGDTIDGTPVLISDSRGPAVIGVLRSRIVVPGWIRELPAPERAMVLRHELEHVRAHDAALHLVGMLCVACMPWNPGLRWLRDRLQLAIETDCDARVLRTGTQRRGYERLLVRLATHPMPPQLAPALAERTSHLERRIVAMRERHSRFPKLQALGSAGLAGMLVVVACNTPTPTVVDSSAAAPAAAVADRYFEFQVDSQAVLAPLMELKYPVAQRKAGVEGEVIVQFVVGTDGTPDMATFEVLKSNQAAFTEAAQAALATAKFKPAMKDGRPVKQVVQLPFVFSLNR